MNESIDTPEFYETVSSWKENSPDAALWSDVIDKINEYAKREVASALASRPAEVDDMAMLIRQLVHSLKKANPNSELPERAVDYLRRKNLLGSPLRSTPSHTTNKEK